jgi:hypothetical protein
VELIFKQHCEKSERLDRRFDEMHLKEPYHQTVGIKKNPTALFFMLEFALHGLNIAFASKRL